MRVTEKGNEGEETEGTLWTAVPQARVPVRRDNKTHTREEKKRNNGHLLARVSKLNSEYGSGER